MNKGIGFVVLAALTLSACVSAKERKASELAQHQAVIQIEQLTLELNQVRRSGASAFAQLHQRAELAYAQGLRDGHAQVLCQPSWPAVEVKLNKTGKPTSSPIAPRK